MENNFKHLKYVQEQKSMEMDTKILKLIDSAKEATKNAYCPYSDFHVGAAVLLENGEIISGSNQENAAYPSGMCAERVAIFHANHSFPDVPVTAIAIAANYKHSFLKRPISPCGSCRQVLLETETRFKKDIEVYLLGEEESFHLSAIKDLLPLAFNDSSFE